MAFRGVNRWLHPAFWNEPNVYKKVRGGLSERGTELCVSCNEDTGLDSCISIELRVNYQEGQGQLCVRCAREVGPAPVVSPPEEIL